MISESYPKIGDNNRVELGQMLQNPVQNTMPHAPGMPHTPGINYVNGMGYLDLGTGTVFVFNHLFRRHFYRLKI